MQDRENQMQVIQYKNVTLQAQRNVYQTQLLKCQDTITHPSTNYLIMRDSGKDNIIIIIVWKHTMSSNDKYHDLPYYVVRIQRRKRFVQLR